MLKNCQKRITKFMKAKGQNIDQSFISLNINLFI